MKVFAGIETYHKVPNWIIGSGGEGDVLEQEQLLSK